MSLEVSDHVLRTLAAIPVGSRILDLGASAHVAALVQLGFDVWACSPSNDVLVESRTRLSEVLPGEEGKRITHAGLTALGYPDNHFDWIVFWGMFDLTGSAEELVEILEEARRVLAPGGWIIAGMHLDDNLPKVTPETFAKVFAVSNFAIAEEPQEELDSSGIPVMRGIFRKPGGGI